MKDREASELVRYVYAAMIAERDNEQLLNFMIGTLLTGSRTIESEAASISNDCNEGAYWANSLRDDPYFESLVNNYKRAGK